MTRKLASIQVVKELVAIKGADRIELALILGWQVVVQKGVHSVGDLVVWYEIDSWLPAEDARYASFEERFSNWGDKRGMRLKTIKLRKQLSQGLIMPLGVFPELTFELYSVGQDVTELLKIEKWEAIEKAPGMHVPGSSIGKRFPAFIRKTDQERIQNIGEMVARTMDDEYEVTVKKDGSSMTVFRVDPSSRFYEDAKALTATKLTWFQRLKVWFKRAPAEAVYGICSRNVLLPLEGNSNFHKAAAGPLAVLRAHKGISIAIQGEVVAPDIQENYEKVAGVEFHMFDLFGIETQAYALPYVRQCFAETNGLSHATLITKGATLQNILGGATDDVVKSLLTYASGKGDNEGVMREGVVFKALTRDFSFKAVSNEYLLATGK